ncbi:mobilization protein MobC [Gemmobacter caeni]|uniref:Mobilization protein MobC n=1 Tax=Gemmobacter caeni TaxID=589035 RepID=A0A2T6ADD3_9RHOB|nr:plasmid mobilization relaxosome protein MobC [Gemmobacter caeni]PTX41830.1 mobilization protein MobC [Gemmobacter caeni]TWI90607.1 mobilization protein MobC [Gemmobacter caeni]
MTSHPRAPQTTAAARPAAFAGASKATGRAAERAGQSAYDDASGGEPPGPSLSRRPTTGGRILSVRVSREEALAFDAATLSAGFTSRSEALRVLVRGAGGAVAPLPEETELLVSLTRELHKIGVNVNQIALAANRRQIALVRAEWDEIGALRKFLPELRLAIGRLVGLRRQAGRAALGTAAGALQSGMGKGDGGA